MRHAQRFLAASLCAAALIIAATEPATSDGRPDARAAGEDSHWPRTTRLPPNVRATRSVVADLERQVELMEWSADRYADWQACLRGVAVSEYGDPDRQFGYLYDERDGTKHGYMPALAVDTKSRPRREDYLFLNFSRKSNCQTNAPLPGGTADPASVRPPAAAATVSAQPRATRLRTRPLRRRTLRSTVGNLERSVNNLKRSARRLLASSERFDEWESCVSWVPVTEYGDPDGKFGYLFGRKDATTPSYRPALAIDRSDWDDPDYMFLALVGGDRPGRTCQDEPGEAVD
jgi:hypothetical protein